MYYKNNRVVEKSFHIVDTIRRKCGGERCYLLPYNINNTITKMVELQFGKVDYIMEVYKKTKRKKGQFVIVRHN